MNGPLPPFARLILFTLSYVFLIRARLLVHEIINDET